MAASSYDRRPIFPESRCPRDYSVPSLAGVMGVEEGGEEGRGDQPYEAWAICLRDHAAEAQRATARPARHRQLHLLRLTSALRSACTSGAWCVGGSCGRMTRRVESLVRLTRHRQARTRGDRRGTSQARCKSMRDDSSAGVADGAVFRKRCARGVHIFEFP